jgi:hypothetical protein
LTKQFEIQLWTPEHDATAFTSSLRSIQKFIQDQAARAMSSKVSTVFVLTEKGDKKVRGYHTLSAISIKFDELPEKMQKKLPRYPQIGATLLGRLGVDESFRASLSARGEKPRLGELLLVDAQRKCLNATEIVASAVMVIDVEEPMQDETLAGARDPMGFYTQYGFTPFPRSPRRLFKRVTMIEKELNL